MATSTTSNGATVDNLNVLDTVTADNTGGAEIIELQDVANALFPTTNAQQTLTIDSSFWTGNLKLTFQAASGFYYTLAATSTDNFTLTQSDAYGNTIGLTQTFHASSASTFLSAFSSSPLVGDGLSNTSLLTALDINSVVGKEVFQATTNGVIANIFSYATANDSFNGTGSQWDVINNFNEGVDKLDFRKLDTDVYANGNTGLSHGLAGLIWIGQEPANTTNLGAAGAYGVWYTTDGSGGSFVYADTNGDGIADLKIEVSGVPTLKQGDFLGVGSAPSITINPIEPSQTNKWLINAADANAGLTVSGTTVNIATGDKVTISFGGVFSVTATVQADGTWSAPVTSGQLHSLADTTYSLSAGVSASGIAPFTASTSDTITVHEDQHETAVLTVDGGSTTPVGSSGAAAVGFVVSGLESDDSGSVVFTDGSHNATVAIVSGTAVSSTVNLSSFSDDATITATLTATDPSGNTFTAVQTNLTLDQDKNEHATLSLAKTLIGSAGATAVSFTITGLDSGDTGAGNTGTVSFVEGAQTVTVGVTGDGTYTANLSSGLNDGTVSTSLTFTDAAGNNFSATGPTVTLDQDKGETASVSGPAGTLGSASASHVAFTVTVPDANETGSLILTDGGNSLTVAVTGAGTYTENLSTWADGNVSASLSVTDPAGNSFAASTTIAIDPDHGETASVSGATITLGSAGASAAAFVVSGLDETSGDTGSLVLTDSSGSFSTTLAVTGDGTYTTDLSTWADGNVSASLSVTDPAGNSFAASTTIAIDPDHGETASVSGATITLGSAGASAAAFVVSGLDETSGDTGSLVLTDSSGSFSTTLTGVTGDGTYTTDLSTWADGNVSASLSVTDPAGNTFAASTTIAIDPDHNETASVSGATITLGSAGASAAAFVVSGLDETSGDTGSLVLTDSSGSFSTTLAVTGDGTYTTDLSTWADGNVSASLSVSDPAGNSFAASTTIAIDPDHGETASVSGATITLGSAGASAAAFVVSGLDETSGDTGSLVLTDSSGSFSTTLAVTGDGTYTTDLSTWADGNVSASLSVSDPAGNSFAASTTIAIDPDHGETASVSGATITLGSAGASAAAFVVSGLDETSGDTGSLVLTDSSGSFSTTLAVTGDGTYTTDLSTWADGNVSASLSVSDPAGNSFAASTTIAIDPDHGETASVSGATITLGSAGASAAAFVVSGLDETSGDTGSLVLTDSSGSFSTTLAVTGDGTYTTDLSTWADGTVSATLHVSDPAGNSFTASTNVTIDPDHGESATVSGPAGTLGSVSAAAVAFVVTTPDGNETGSLTLTDGGNSLTVAVTGNGTYTENLSTWADGTVSATLHVSDPAGNSFTASTNVTIDPDSGESATVSGPAGTLGSVSAAAVAFVVTTPDGNETGSLTLTDGGNSLTVAVTGNGTYTENLSTWADGTVSATLHVSDPAGNSFTASTNVTIDRDSGETATLAVSPTTETVGAATATFTISGLDAGDTGAGNTATLVVTETGQTPETFAVTPTATSGTYTETLGFTSAGTATASLTVTDSAGNTIPAAANQSITLVAAPTPTLTIVEAKHSGNNKEVTGDVSDATAGSVTIKAVDTTDSTTLGTTTVSVAANTVLSWSITTTAPNAGDTVVVTAWESTGGTATTTVTASSPAGAAGSPIDLALTDPSAGESVTVTVADVPADWSLNEGTNNGNGTWAVTTSDPSALAVTTPSTYAGAVVLDVSESWTNADGSTGSAFDADNVEAYAPGAPIFAVSGDDTLTGAGGNDEFVFAQPIGNDQVYNFNAASDQIDLIGFGLSGYSALQPSIADNASGNAVVTLGQGETITLVGVNASQLSASDFVFNQEPTTTNSGTMTVGDGATLPLGGTIDNTGTIAINSTGDASDLEILVRGATLQGGGQLTMSDSSANVVFGGDPSAVLTNVDNTISGAGQLGDGQLTLDNEGVIDATGTNALVIDTGANTVANSGTLEATGSGGLIVNSAVDNSGDLWANGGNITINGAVTGNGTATISGAGTLEFAAASAETVNFAAGSTGTLQLDNAASFTGAVSGLTTTTYIDLADLPWTQGQMTETFTPNSGSPASGGKLTVSDGTQSDTINLAGDYTQSGWTLSQDSKGDTLVVDPPLGIDPIAGMPPNGNTNTTHSPVPRQVAGDVLDLAADISSGANQTIGYSASANGAGGTLNVSDGTPSPNIALFGQYAAAGFATEGDPSGGPIVTHSAAQDASSEQTLLTNPHK